MDYTVRITDKLLRFDTTTEDITVTLLPFAQTPNAPYEVHKINVGDEHTVTVRADPSTTDFLLPDGSTSIVLDDAVNAALIRIPADGQSPAFVTMGGTGGGGGGGGGVPAPDVSIVGPPEVIFRSDHKVEVDVAWAAAGSATTANFSGVEVYLEDPDISTGANAPMDGTSVTLDGSSQMSAKWAPVPVGESTKSPATLFLDTTMGGVSNQTYKTARDVRIYLAAYGPFSHAHPVRATDTGPSPNVKVHIPLGRGQGESGMEYAFLVTLPDDAVTVATDYNRLDPQYYLTFRYTPPPASTPVPPGLNHFGGCRIVFVYEDSAGGPIFPGTDTGINVPVAQSSTGYKSPAYVPSASGGKFRCYFCSEDDSQPLGIHIDSLVEGVTPFAYAVVPPVPKTPDVTHFTISGQKTIWLLDGSMVAEATFAWELGGTGDVRYAGVYLYLVGVTGGTTPLTVFPQPLTGQQSNVDLNFILDIQNVPANPEAWVIAAISVDNNGKLADDPKQYALTGHGTFHSPTVVWNIGPPTPGSPGSGTEHAPAVSINSGATATAAETLSADGVRMVTFNVGSWTNPDDNQFGSAQVAMVVNHDPTKPTFWSVPANAGSFVTPAMPAFGNIGAAIPVDFYVVSDDPQGNKNSLQIGTTPVIHSTYTPTSGAIIPARTGWFDDTQFSWGPDGLTADSISAKIVQVGKTLVVGGAPDTSFAGQSNGQIAVKNSAGVLRAWMGEQQPGQGSGAPLWGGWFGQLWIGGTSPLDAPIWIDNQGIIEVGGIAAARGTSYPYVSVRDQHGIEMGRIGAALNQPSGTPGDSVGTSPPAQLTAGAWFTQLAIGGSNLSNWNVLIVPDASNPLGSQFLIRNINTLNIDYAAHSGSPSNAAYQMSFGNNVWATGGATAWQFPGIHLVEIDGVGNRFGATYLNRGVVLQGTQNQGYPTLASLVMFNGNSTGQDFPANFWGELALYSPLSPYRRTIYLAAGSGTGGPVNGDPSFLMLNQNGNMLFQVDTAGNTFAAGMLQGVPVAGTGAATPIKAYAYSVMNVGGSPIPVIDSTGHWIGQPIATSSGQSPWTQPINGAGFSLSGAGNISASAYFVTASGSAVINSSGQFVGTGVDVGAFNHVYAGYIATNQHSGGVNQIDTGTINMTGTLTCTSNVVVSGVVQAFSGFYGSGGVAINSSGSFVSGAGVDTTGGIKGAAFAVRTMDVINSSGNFVGAGVNTPFYGIAGLGFNPYNNNSSFYTVGQYFGQSEVIVIGGVTLRFMGGVYVGHF